MFHLFIFRVHFVNVNNNKNQGMFWRNINLMVKYVLFKSTLNFGIPPVLIFQLEVYYKVDRLLTGLTAQQKGTTAQWYSNKTSLHPCKWGQNMYKVKF